MSGSDYPKIKLSHDNYQTDEWLMDLFEDWFDPCPLIDVDELSRNGLHLPWSVWGDKVFVNPPYSKPLPWVKKAIEEKQLEPDMTIVMLLKHDSSTEWYRLLVEARAHFLMVNGRLKHRTGKGAAFPSLLVVL
jgi:hypothetical protein